MSSSCQTPFIHQHFFLFLSFLTLLGVCSTDRVTSFSEDMTSTGLHKAARRGDKVKITQYLSAGDDINSLDELGRSPLMKAVLSGDVSVLEVFLVRRCRRVDH